METNQILKEFKEKIENLYGKRLKDIILYGSFAREQQTIDSDIALAMVLVGDISPGREIDRIIDIITEINLEYGVLLSVYPVSEKNYNTLKSPILLNIRKEGVKVY